MRDANQAPVTVADPDFERAYRTIQDIDAELVQSVYMGDEPRKELLSAIGTGGHALANETFGTGKTTAAKALSLILGGKYGRVQGNNDVTPLDITGGMVYNRATGTFEFQKGPIFANVVLADEFQRLNVKAQDGLVEVMAEGQVTPTGADFSVPLEKPFVVLGTRNPDGLPIRQGVLDRFVVCVQSPPQKAAERAKVDAIKAKKHSPRQQVQAGDINNVVAVVEDVVQISPDLQDVANSFIDYLFEHPAVDPEESITGGYRGYMSLKNVAKFAALCRNSKHVEAQDLVFAASPTQRHRVAVDYKAAYPRPKNGIRAKGVTPDDIIADTVQQYLKPAAIAAPSATDPS